MTTSFKGFEGFYVTAEDDRTGRVTHGPRPGLDGPPVAGPYEQWTAEPQDDGTYAFKSWRGMYLSAQPDGSLIANRTWVKPWEKFTQSRHPDGGFAWKTDHGTYIRGLAQAARESLRASNPRVPPPGASGIDHAAMQVGPWENWINDGLAGASPGHGATARPLVGPLRIENRLFRDDTGYRRVLFTADFPLLRILRDNPSEALRSLDAMAAATYQGFRVFLGVGIWEYWNGLEVAPVDVEKWRYDGNPLRGEVIGRVPAWPEFDELWDRLLRESRARQLRLHATFGDMQGIASGEAEIALHERLARIAAANGGSEVIALWEVTNEYWQNRTGGASDASIAQMGRVIAAVKRILPDVLTGQGAGGDIDPPALRRASTHGEVCIVHPTRQPPTTAIKHAMSLVWQEGQYRSFPKPFWEGEPAGVDGETGDMYQPINDLDQVLSLYAMHALTGQATVHFTGNAVRNVKPIDAAPGFTEIPRQLSALPEDVATWSHEHGPNGGIVYWTDGHQFATVTCEGWNYQPPRPVGTWRILRGSGQEETGTGDLPRLPAGYGARFIVGTWR